MTDHAGLKELAERLGYHSEHPVTCKLVLTNPDGPKTAAAILALLAEIERMRKALQPFAAIGEKLFNMIPDQSELYLSVSGDPESAITAGAFRSAARALGGK